MKKQLLATTALVGASLFVTGDAWAQASPITMGVKGYYRQFFEIYSQPSRSDSVLAPMTGPGVVTYTGATGTANTVGKARSHSVELEGRTFFTGEGKLDNGITPGVMIQWESFNKTYTTPSTTGPRSGVVTANQERRAFGYFKGAFGQVLTGNTDSAAKRQHYWQPFADVLGPDSPSGAYPLGTNNTWPSVASNGATKLIYVTPNFGGFTFSVSYAPDASSDGEQTGRFGFEKDGIGGNRYRGANSEEWSLGANYKGTFGALTVGGSVGYTGSSNECKGRTTAGAANFSAGCVGASKDVTAPVGSLAVQYAGFELGLSVAQVNNVNGDNLDRTVFSTGLSYYTGPWQFMVAYSKGDYDLTRAPLSATGAATGAAVTSTDTLHMATANVVYTLGPGVKLDVGYAYQKYEYGVNASYRNAGDFGFTPISEQTAHTFLIGSTFSY